ncbi:MULTISPECIES: hypothetical protein [Frankia]|uniref:Uncharacterized protein n=1 Tax=Frankia alni (strain DSM 45986 / CECT 9034 / ACN14a) TaxID=326424 RepID=Q0RLF5_FRAAA|nr:MULTISPECIES: hypothetical protein [Frankia]CAJ61649.1 hypothetical protein FRAAL3005 [Frankia alni ACN14a]
MTRGESPEQRPDPRLPRGPDWDAQVGPRRADDIAARLAAEEAGEETGDETLIAPAGWLPTGPPPPPAGPSSVPPWQQGPPPAPTPVYGGPPLPAWDDGGRPPARRGRGWLRRLFRR